MPDVNDTIDTAAQNLLRLTTELSEAQADSAMLARLKAADGRVKSLTIEHNAAIILQNHLLDAEAKSIEENRFNGLSNVSVVDNTPTESAISSSFTITYTSPIYDMYANKSVPQVHTVLGFASLPPLVLEYLITRQPGQIPTKILGMASDPREAFSRYSMSRRRGYS